VPKICCRILLLLAAMVPSVVTFAQQKATPRQKRASEMHQPQITYLALGDSYTIGEAVALQQSFPYQTVALLRQQGFAVTAPEIVAATGWTTDELAAAIRGHRFLPQYNLVTLLIGVNNQYRGRSLENYEEEFSDLLKQALHFAGGKKKQVVVLSIPDYGITPFAKNNNPERISREVDAFNAAAKAICNSADVYFLDINALYRNTDFDHERVATDGLHPSGKAYLQWAEQLAALLRQRLE
jgi:lysophospholipase L1-like esterase